MFLRHVGKHGDRKVAIIFREVPGEPHMCLVTYTELLNQNVHDPMIHSIESDIGQSSDNLADALNRSFTRDGRSILQYLHVEGLLKKVNTELIVVTPQPNVKIKLNELNKMLNEMKLGEEAIKKMTEIDQSMGMQSPGEVARRMRNQTKDAIVATPGALDDNSIASNLREQAAKMSAEAKGLLAEAERLLKEAHSLEPKAKSETKPKKSRTKVVA
jgi:hypothetical protein